MGTGIMGAIPISFRFGSSIWSRYSSVDALKNKEKFTKHAPKDFFDYYTDRSYVEQCDNATVISYVIKPKILLPNFKEFFFKFYKLIGDYVDTKCYDKFNDQYDAVVNSNDLDKFVEYFDDHIGCAPAVSPYFRVAHIVSNKNLLVYRGSFKAMHEGYSSLLHMERLLWTAMKHPLAKVVKIKMSL
jgi:hypothetical protein